MADGTKQADETEGADPTDNLRKRNPGDQTAADAISEDDPHKAEKLSKLGSGDDEAAGGTE